MDDRTDGWLELIYYNL